TRWSLVLAAREDSAPALAALCSAYHRPILRYVRSRVRDDDRARDVTQEFFASQVVTGSVFKRAEKGQGRFRAWLVRAVNNHLSNTWDRERAEKRGGGAATAPLEDASGVAVSADADALFDREW